MNKKLYFTVLLIGFFWVFYSLQNHSVSLSQTAWFFWSANFLFLPVWAGLTIVEGFYKSKPKTFPRLLVMTLLTAFMAGLFHVIVGLFSSILQPIEPFHFFHLDGYNKNFGLDLIFYHLNHFSFLWPGFLALKSTLLLIEPGLRRNGHSLFRDGILPLIVAFILTAIFKDRPQTELIVSLSAFLFLPWTIILGKDRYDKIATLEPELMVPCQLPIRHTYRPQVSPFWAVLVLFVAVFILGLVFQMAVKINQVGQTPLVFILMMVLIGVTVAFGFIFAGVNMLFSYRQIHLTRSDVSVFEKAFLIVIPRIKEWRCSISDYSKVEARTRAGVSNNSKSIFIVELVHKNDKNKNIELYRAYYPDDYKKITEKWSELLELR